MNKIFAFLIGVIGGFLGSWGGAENTDKNWRRVGIPVLITLVTLITLKHWLVLSILSLIGVLCIGYGIPNLYSDEGSPLGRFYYTRFNANHLLTDIFTRGTVGLLACLTLLSIPILNGCWICYIIGSLIIILVYSLLSWRTLGSFKFNNKWLTWSEFVTYFTLSIVAGVLALL